MRATELKKGLKLPRVRVPEFAPEPKPTVLHKMMSEMFRSVLDEDSEAMVAVRGSPYADQLIQRIHKNMNLSHKLKFQEKERIQWKEIKEVEPNFVLIAGTTGTAAVNWDGSRYTVIMANAEGVTRGSNPSINALMGDIKEGIGKPKKFWEPVTVKDPSEYDNYERRFGSDRKTGPTLPTTVRRSRTAARTLDPKKSTGLDQTGLSGGDNLAKLFTKLKPLMLKYLTTALADVKGAAGIAMKNDSYNTAKKKLEIAAKLSGMIEHLSDPDMSDGFHRSSQDELLKNKIQHAVVMAASYYYPDETGDIEAGYSGALRPRNNLGPNKVINDIAKGDSKKLATVMAYLKQAFLYSK